MRFIKLHLRRRRNVTASIGSIFCSAGECDYRCLAAKANQQMTDKMIFKRVQPGLLLLVSLATEMAFTDSVKKLES